MIKSFLISRLGIGRIPAHEKPVLENEGIRFVNEGIPGSMTYYHFKTNGKSFSRKKQDFVGSLAITEKKLIGFGYNKRIVNIPLDHPKFQELHFQIDGTDTLAIVYDAHLINPDQSGTIELKFRLNSIDSLRDLLEIEPAAA